VLRTGPEWSQSSDGDCTQYDDQENDHARMSKRRSGARDASTTLMPYTSNEDLPPSIRAHLPPHAQDIYREAFNHAFERAGFADEARAHRIAWAAVKRTYEKLGDNWVPRDRDW
jgi:cation transport regulator